MFIKLLHVKEHRVQYKFILPGNTPNQREENEFVYDFLCIQHYSINWMSSCFLTQYRWSLYWVKKPAPLPDM